MSGSFFATLPKGVRIRQSAVAVVLSQATIAGQNIFDSPLDPVPANATAVVNFYSAERRDTISAGGGRPAFKVQYTLSIQIIFADASAEQAILQSDILKQQVFDALFEDPVWPSMLEQPSSIEEKREDTKSDGERYRVEHLVAIIASWRETFGARGTTVLSPSGPPGRSAAVQAPLTQVNTTYVAGSAPGPDGQGSVQTTFTTETTIQPA
jgi:hypothetical protein